MTNLKFNLLNIKYLNGDNLFENNKYFNKYCELIKINKETKKEKVDRGSL